MHPLKPLPARTFASRNGRGRWGARHLEVGLWAAALAAVADPRMAPASLWPQISQLPTQHCCPTSSDVLPHALLRLAAAHSQVNSHSQDSFAHLSCRAAPSDASAHAPRTPAALRRSRDVYGKVSEFCETGNVGASTRKSTQHSILLNYQ